MIQYYDRKLERVKFLISVCSQGSESDVVIYYVGNASGQTCKHVYTAVTRGRRAVFMVGKLSELEKAIFTRDFPRRSRLSRRLYNELKDFDMQVTCLSRLHFRCLLLWTY